MKKFILITIVMLSLLLYSSITKSQPGCELSKPKVETKYHNYLNNELIIPNTIKTHKKEVWLTVWQSSSLVVTSLPIAYESYTLLTNKTPDNLNHNEKILIYSTISAGGLLSYTIATIKKHHYKTPKKYCNNENNIKINLMGNTVGNIKFSNKCPIRAPRWLKRKWQRKYNNVRNTIHP